MVGLFLPLLHPAEDLELVLPELRPPLHLPQLHNPLKAPCFLKFKKAKL
jgi:hypothetical protein